MIVPTHADHATGEPPVAGLANHESPPLHGLTSVLGPAKRVTAMSGVVVKTREFAGRSITPEMDDNTAALLDFGGGICAIAYETASGNIIEDFAAACYFGTKGEIRGLQLNGEPALVFPGRAGSAGRLHARLRIRRRRR
jgi:hypothetical protein